jgi:1-acyl-sn-glycerol-3-phosphate acyltransferase
MIYRVTWLIIRALFHLLFRFRTTGSEKVPREGPVILASNHISYLDPPVVGIGVWRPGHFMAKEEIFRNPAFRWYITRLNAFPIKRGAADRAALKKTLDMLAEGRMLAIFPEGTRSETGELQEPEMGVGMIAHRSGAQVVPVYITGTQNVLPKKGGFRLAPVSVVYGEPIRFALPEGQKAGREEYEAAARQIMAAIAELRDRQPARS